MTFINQILKSLPKFANKLAPSRMITSDPIFEILSNNPSNELFAEFDQSNSTNNSFEIKFTFSKLIPTRWDELCQAWRVSQNEKTFYRLKIPGWPTPWCINKKIYRVLWGLFSRGGVREMYEPIPDTVLDSDNADFMRQMFKNRELCNYYWIISVSENKYWWISASGIQNPSLTGRHDQLQTVQRANKICYTFCHSVSNFSNL